MFATSLGLGGKERFFRFENAFKGNLEVYFCVWSVLVVLLYLFGSSFIWLMHIKIVISSW